MGTMHVSSKVAFHLSDSFYTAIKNVDVVGLETNPETWQDDLSRYEFGFVTEQNIPNEYFKENTLRIEKYEKELQRALASNPSTINSLLYRTYGNESSDFEEDTYLDMYIFQVGKKLKKKVIGLENYDESMKLITEAQRDAVKDKNRKERSYDYSGDYSIDKLQDAYRSGNLDLLDSITKYNSVSPAYDEKFMYRRNEIQANSIDSVLKTGVSIFSGVGAAHLPGERGVIELLRKQGYKLRPVRMGMRAARNKELIDKIRVPVVFTTTTSPDGFYKVDIPGKLYSYGDDQVLQQQQFSDVANGSYYMITRVLTSAWMWGQDINQVFKTVDSLLYENIPGKIISRNPVTRNGYRGIDVVNRTRRGDLQRYQIYVTPYEVLVFKMSGNGDYVTNGEEGKRFFGSLQLKTAQPQANQLFQFSPGYGGFSVLMPHAPNVAKRRGNIYEAGDVNKNYYRVVRTDIHNYQFAGNDSMDLDMLHESFSGSGFIDSVVSSNYLLYEGYPALDAVYAGTNGKLFYTRFLLKGPHYYTIVSNLAEKQAASGFLNSFRILPLNYGDAKPFRDTLLYFTVQTPVIPKEPKKNAGMSGMDYYGSYQDEDETEKEKLETGVYRIRVFEDDSTGEKISVSYYRTSRYYYTSDSSDLFKEGYLKNLKDSGWIIRKFSERISSPGRGFWDVEISEPESSRMLKIRAYFAQGNGHALITETDTLSAPGKFLTDFYSSFKPDSISGVDPQQKKSGLFFSDYFSKDSLLHKRAIDHVSEVVMDSSDFRQLKQIIEHLDWNEKKYLVTKRALIQKLADIKTRESADYLQKIYFALGDTVELKYATLESLLGQKTKYAYSVFRDILKQDIPVYQTTAGSYSNEANFFDALQDSLQLTRQIFDDILPLVNLDDYKIPVMNLLGLMLDSGLVIHDYYKAYQSKFTLEAKQELQKQLINERKKSINKAEDKKSGDMPPIQEEYNPPGNEVLALYAKLLIPFMEADPQLRTMMNQLLQSADDRLKYSIAYTLLQMKKPVADSILNYFAKSDVYRYQLYMDLDFIGQLEKFPGNLDKESLAKSSLMSTRPYSLPDTISFLQKMETTYREKQGLIYFYKYKDKKDDPDWKIAYSGIMSPEEKKYYFISAKEKYDKYVLTGNYDPYDISSFTDLKLTEDKPVEKQLKKVVKRLQYAATRNAEFFYQTENGYSYTDYTD